VKGGLHALCECIGLSWSLRWTGRVDRLFTGVARRAALEKRPTHKEKIFKKQINLYLNSLHNKFGVFPEKV
jgi:hypothetical protein